MEYESLLNISFNKDNFNSSVILAYSITVSFESLIINDLTGISTSTMTHDEVLDYYDMKGINPGRGVGILWLFIVAFRVIFCLRLVTAFNGSRK